MKMTLNMTYEDGKKVIDALENVACENGWSEEELEDCGVIEEYTRAVDAALSAMGISINIDATSSEDEDEDEDEDEYYEDEDEDEDEDEGECISESEANRLMNFAYAIFHFCNNGRDRVDNTFKENAIKFAQKMFCRFCEAEGITRVYEDE